MQARCVPELVCGNFAIGWNTATGKEIEKGQSRIANKCPDWRQAEVLQNVHGPEFKSKPVRLNACFDDTKSNSCSQNRPI
jgi:hypothetical protein